MQRPGRSILVALAVVLAVGAAGCDRERCSTLDAGNVDECLRLNQIQTLGTHNSYHLQPSTALRAAMDSISPGWGEHWEYDHRPLVEQLELLGIRQLELDVFHDPEGGHYLRPAGLSLVDGPQELEEPALQDPGFKVLHVQDLDYETTCPTLVGCLEEVRDWSQANPAHLPILILVEVKDGPLSDTLDLDTTTPPLVRAAELELLDAEIRSVFREGHILTPDEIRGGYATLSAALEAEGWPTLASSRGRIFFALDNTGVHRDEYLREHPNLEGRVMFVSSPPGEPTAAFVKMNESIDDEALIRDYVAQGLVVRTRSDIPVREARSGDVTRREAALRSGAQWVSTDYPEESPFGSGYVVRLPEAGNGPARCNPVTAPPGCRSEWIVE